MFLPMLMCCSAMRWARRRYPRIGVGGLILVAVGVMGVFLLTLETVWVRTGQYSYMGVVSSLSLWPGHYYQYPLYSWAAWSVFWGLMVALRYFRNDRGETVASEASTLSTSARSVARPSGSWRSWGCATSCT
jgi:hypothetical protein